jgi:hypothetical protein
MLAFEVYVNKVKVCTAAIDELEFVGASLFSLGDMDGRTDERKVQFSVHGANMKGKKTFNWVHYQMKKGHSVEIRIVDAKKTDPPKETKCSGGSCET